MTENTQPDADAQIAALLRAADHDAAPPDRALLDQLRTQSLAAFQSSSPQATNRWKGRRMFNLVRGLAAAVAAAIVGLLVISPYLFRGPTLRDAIDKTLGADSVLLFAGAAIEVKHGRDFRMELGEEKYRIGNVEGVWTIDERANRAAREESTFHEPSGQVDLFALLGVRLADPNDPFLETRPTSRRDFRGLDCHYYSGLVRNRTANEEFVVSAYVHAESGQLVHMYAHPRGPHKGYLQLGVWAPNQLIPADKFLIKDTLTEDGRVGKVVDVQGIVTLKPVMGERWTPVQDGLVLKPGDWVRTDPRGANAVALKLMKATSVIAGPGSILEVVKPTEVRVLAGEFEFNVPDRTIDVIGPDGKKEAVTGKKLLRVDKEKLVALTDKQEPMWLKGFKGALAQANESIGSLVAKVDGRDVPLTVGYHKVSVDIRDQIARTVIEESFVNRTKVQLEGVFYFPLPQDASISGFGMWIGNELVEADVVEKQRAREIYETILRERRDPGLLEWAGGNLFKARVFPIEPLSEKRIKISYTQVLPLRGNRYRYSYGLQSELLKLHPLRELSLDVKISSAVPLKSVECPTHATRRDQTRHSGHVEFTAQEYTPTRDFEVVVEVDGRQNELAIIPHRRGDDGYFMLQLLPPSPPASGGEGSGVRGVWERELLPTGDPVHLLILADTSASMDKGQRLVQEAFLGALFASLTPKDTLNLGTCDVNCDWAFEKPVPADAKNLATARDFLARRGSLGWTDLDKAFASAFKQAGPKSHIIYLGDGVVTTGDCDPQGFVKRLQLLARASSSALPLGGEGPGVRGFSQPPRDPLTPNPSPPEGRGGPDAPVARKDFACHAIALSSTFEPAVLKAIAGIGGGSVRRISGEQGPALVARELLSELSQATLSDLKVEFRGLATARVYPDILPNLPPGSQQIVMGRYLPSATRSSSSPLPQRGRGAGGEGGDPAKAPPLTPNPSPPEGIGGPDTPPEVIVTGRQGDKEVRYKAAISLQDDEKGNSFIPRLWARMHLDRLLDQGQSEAVRDEVIALSEEFNIITPYTSFLVLETDADRERFKVQRRFRMRDGEKYFATGRDNASYELVQQQMKRAGTWRLGLRTDVLRSLTGLGRDIHAFRPERVQQLLSRLGEYPGQGGGYGGGVDDYSLGQLTSPTSSTEWFGGVPGEMPMGGPVSDLDMKFDANFLGRDVTRDKSESLAEELRSGEWEGFLQREDNLDDLRAARFSAAGDEITFGAFPTTVSMDAEVNEYFLEEAAEAASGRVRRPRRASLMAASYDSGLFFRHIHTEYNHYTQWVPVLFPHLPPPPAKQKPPKRPWPADAQALAKSLLRGEKMSKVQGGLDIRRTSQGFETRWQEVTSESRRRELFSPSRWATTQSQDWSQPVTSWCDGKEYGTFGHALLLGRTRSAVPDDLRPPYEMYDYSLTSLEQTYQGYTPTLKAAGNERTLLVLTHPKQKRHEVRIEIDTARHVVLSIESFQDGKSTGATRFYDFIEVAGCWWAQRLENFNAEGQRTGLTTQTIQALAAADFDAAVAKELALRASALLVPQPLPKLDAAKKAHAEGKATFADHFRLLLHFCQSQQWTRVFEHLEQLEKLAGNKAGARWIRLSLQSVGRRHEDMRKALLAETARLTNLPPDHAAFLAQHLHGLAASALAGQEILDLVQRLESVYRRQPAHLQAVKRWQQTYAAALQQMGRTAEALKLLRQLAVENPRDANVHYYYAQGLVSAGDYEAAYAWLRQALALPSKWHAHETTMLREQHVQLLNHQGRWADAAAYLAEWLKEEPESSSPYAQYVSTLVRMGKEQQADQLLQQWLKEGMRPAPLSAPVAARLEAAIGQMMGNDRHVHTGRIDERWLKPLADAAIFFARHETQLGIAQRVMAHHDIQRCDEYRRVQQAAHDWLTRELGKLTPAQIELLAGWLPTNDPPMTPAIWRQLAQQLLARWKQEKDAEAKHALGHALLPILHHKVGDTAEYLAFLRLQRTDGPTDYRAHYVQALLAALQTLPWSAEIESEAFALLQHVTDEEEPTARLMEQIHHLHALNDAMVARRREALDKAIKEPEKLTRIQQRDKKQANLKAAREGLADRLKQEAAKQPAELGRWLRLEQLTFDTLSERSATAIAAACWEALGPKPVLAGEEESPDLLDAIFRTRHLALVTYLATRPNADAGLVDRLLKYTDEGIAAEKDATVWKQFKVRLLIALDRPKDLEQTLRTWLTPTLADSRQGVWRLPLGYLLAEQGRFAEAIKLFEGVEKVDELPSAAYSALANWYMAVNRRSEHEKALDDAWRVMDEHRMANLLYYKLRPWQRGDSRVPSELDRDVLRVFAALFEKSGSPANYLYQLLQFYQASRDFRLLAVMVDGVVGHTPQRVYPFLQGMQGIFSEIRDEATVDELAAQLEKTRLRAKTAVDQRALDLLELQVRRRAAELKNQPGPHRDAALAALKRAFNRDWADGERRFMADLLHTLGKITEQPLASEQLRQLETLAGMEKAGTHDRLHIVWRQAQTLHAYGQTPRAIDVLEFARREASRKVLLHPDEPLATLVDMHKSLGHFARGEKHLLDELVRPQHGQHQNWLTQQLLHLYHDALARNGEVSLGKDGVLYKALEKRLHIECAGQEQNHRQTMFNLLIAVYRTAHGRKLDGVAADVRTFAFQRFAELALPQTNYHDSIVGQVAHLVHDLLGPKEGITFLLDRIENEPRWLRWHGQDAWSRHGDALGRWRTEAGELGELEARLLKAVLAHLRLDLEGRYGRIQAICHGHQAHYWSAKEADFLKTAEAVLAERKQSHASVRYIAEYMYHGLRRYDRAIAVLLEAHQGGVLQRDGVDQLVGYLHERGRFVESITLLEPLVVKHADALNYRTLLMHAYFRTKQADKLLSLLKDTDAFFHQKDLWTEGVLAALGQSTLQNELFAQSIAYYAELIPLIERTRPNRGIGDGTLSHHYASKARAHAGLAQTPEAVEAASGAIVAWGPRHDQRRSAVETLVQILVDAPDLDAYWRHWDAKVEKEGQDSPVVRKALGQAYVRKEQHAKAIPQLRLAAELQPHDTEIHKLLVAAFDKLGDKEGAIQQLLASVELSRREITLFQDLGKRYQVLGKRDEAERAYTSIVEALPTESESHTLLAESRQAENRWPEAIQHWEQVARIRALEPTGLVQLAKAQVHEKKWDKASETVKRLRARPWPQRFTEVENEIRGLEREIEKGRKSR